METDGTWFRVRRGRLSVVISVVTLGICLLVAASSTQAAIVVGRSVGKFRLGYTKAKVRRIYGKPSSADTFPQEGETVWRYIGRSVVIGFKHGRLKGISAYSKRQRTSKGIGPGSSYAATRAAYPKAKCEEGTYGPQARTCTLYRKFRGYKTRTDFVFYKRNLPMREVEIGRQSLEG